MNNLDRLKELTLNLPSLRALIGEESVGAIKYKMVSGSKVVGINLFNDGAMAIQRVESKGKGIFPRHKHEVHEWLIVLVGSFEYETNNKKIIVSQNGYVYFAPFESHELIFTEDAILLAITVPADGGYPSGRT